MLPAKTIRNLKGVFGVICNFGAVPFFNNDRTSEFYLKSVPSNDIKMVHVKSVLLLTLGHTLFLSVRIVQAYLTKRQKFFILFVHFAWTVSFFMISWLHITLHISQFGVKAYCNGLFKFFGSYMAMPGARFSAKERRRTRKKPSVIDILVLTFIIGAVINTLVSVQIFIIFSNSYQFLYSTLPPCWRRSSPFIIIPFIIYEAAILWINWTLLLFFIIIHLVHLFCARDYLFMLRQNTRNGILKLSELLHHYRSIQILHNHYNESIANYMPPELAVVLSLTFAGNIGTIRMFHLNAHVSIPEMALLPLISCLTGAFQMIFYSRAGDLHHLSSFFSKSSKKGLFGESKLAKMYLKSFSPICVRAGNLLEIRKFTVVKFVGGVVVGTARLAVLVFIRKWSS